MIGECNLQNSFYDAFYPWGRNVKYNDLFSSFNSKNAIRCRESLLCVNAYSRINYAIRCSY